MGRWKTVATAVFVVLVVVFGAYRWRVGANLDAAKQRVRDAGMPVTYAELDAYYAQPSSGENRAHLLQFAIDAMVVPGPLTNDNLPIAGQADLPHRSEPIPDEQLQAMRAYTLQNLAAIEAVFESFAYPECRFPIEMNAGASMDLGHLSWLRSLARILSVRTLVFSLSGDTASASKELIGIIELSDSLDKEPVLISQLVRIAMYGIGLSAMEQAMNRADFTPDQLKAMQDRLVEADDNRGFMNGFIGERCIWTEIEAVGLDGEAFAGGRGNGIDIQDLWYDLVYRPLGLLDMDGVRYYEAFEEIFAAGDLPIQEQIKAGEAIGERVGRRAGLVSMSATFVPAVARALEADVRNHAHVRTAILAFAAARYKAEKGEYPETADALLPAYLDALPIDPVDGNPIRYRKLDHGYVVYSLGQNGTDENGEELDEQRFWLDGDLTFTVERP